MDLFGHRTAQVAACPIQGSQCCNKTVTMRIDDANQELAAGHRLDKRNLQVEQNGIRRFAQRIRQCVMHLGTELEGLLRGPPSGSLRTWHLQSRRTGGAPKSESGSLQTESGRGKWIRVDLSPGGHRPAKHLQPN